MIIYKYPVPITDKFSIEMPLDSKILSFQMQNEQPVLWAAVRSHARLVERKFEIRGTGHEIDMDKVLQYIGTIQMPHHDYIFVWHLFEVISHE